MSEPAIAPQGLSHMTFVVADLDRMERLLVTVLGARKVYDSGRETFSLAPERFFVLGPSELWIAIMQGEPLPARSYNHVAFRVAEADLPVYRARLSAEGLELREGRPRVDGEGASLYFYDHDNHLFELHTGTLPERLQRYGAAGDVPASPAETATNQ